MAYALTKRSFQRILTAVFIALTCQVLQLYNNMLGYHLKEINNVLTTDRTLVMSFFFFFNCYLKIYR